MFVLVCLLGIKREKSVNTCNAISIQRTANCRSNRLDQSTGMPVLSYGDFDFPTQYP